MNQHKTHKIVEYIRTQHEFPFDIVDVERELDNVLGYFGFHPELDDAERNEIQTALQEMAGAVEWAEMARLAEMGSQRELGWLYRTFYPEQFMETPRAKSMSYEAWLRKMPLG